MKVKVFIFGAPGSGKSTLARRLADTLDLPLFELDELFHSGETDKQITNPTERTKLIEKLLGGGQAWVIEGLYRDNWVDKLIGQADVVLFVDTPFLTRIVRSITRTIKGMLSGNSDRESSSRVAASLIRLNHRFEKVHRPEFIERLKTTNVKLAYVKSYKDALTIIQQQAKDVTSPKTAEKIERILVHLRKKYGELTPKLIHENEVHGHLTYLLLGESGKKYIAKLFGDTSEQNGVGRELNNRKRLQRLFLGAKLQHCVITKIIDYNIQGNWVIAKYEAFQTLYEQYMQNKAEFRRNLLQFYQTFLLPLLHRLPLDTVVPGDYSLDDIGYNEGRFFFYDMEKEKTLFEIVVDVYAKLIHLYVKKRGEEGFKDEELLSGLIFEIRALYTGDIFDKDIFNSALKERMQSPVLRSVLADKITETFNRFRL